MDEDVLSGFRNWLLKTAWEYSSNPEDVHDLAQEGHIAMWRALSSYRESSGVSLPTHLMNKARWRMADVRKRGSFTGKPSQAGKKNASGTASTLGAEQSTDFGLSDIDPVGLSREQAEDAMIAYHHGEIMQAISSLKPDHRERVLAWFWRGEVNPSRRAWWDDKRYGAKAKLRPQLEHLRGLV